MSFLFGNVVTAETAAVKLTEVFEKGNPSAAADERVADLAQEAINAVENLLSKLEDSGHYSVSVSGHKQNLEGTDSRSHVSIYMSPVSPPVEAPTEETSPSMAVSEDAAESTATTDTSETATVDEDNNAGGEETSE